MIVVSDTSPVTALLTIGKVELLCQLFHEVIIPMAVRNELLRTHSTLPAWLEVKNVQDHTRLAEYAMTVDLGKAEAIELAREFKG